MYVAGDAYHVDTLRLVHVILLRFGLHARCCIGIDLPCCLAGVFGGPSQYRTDASPRLSGVNDVWKSGRRDTEV